MSLVWRVLLSLATLQLAVGSAFPQESLHQSHIVIKRVPNTVFKYGLTYFTWEKAIVVPRRGGPAEDDDGKSQHPIEIKSVVKGCKCTKGEHGGCDYKELDCPDLSKQQFWCDNCGRKDDEGNCKGDPEFGYEYKVCECADDLDFSQEPIGSPGLVHPNFRRSDAKLANLPEITYAPAQPRPSPTPQCNMKETSSLPWDVLTSGVYTNFCNYLNGRDDTKALAQTINVTGNVILDVKSKKHGVKEQTTQNPKACDADQSKASNEDSCAGKEGASTNGEQEASPDQENETECPDLANVRFWCCDCGGKDEDGKCKGDPKYDYEFKGCECFDEPDWSKEPGPCIRRMTPQQRELKWMRQAKLRGISGYSRIFMPEPTSR